MSTIDYFDGTEYDWLSNFHPSPIPWTSTKGFLPHAYLADTVEHAYQAEKAGNASDFVRVITATTPGLAKRIGRSIRLRHDWERVKDEVMLTALRLKFKDAELQAKLLDTGDAVLVEGNHWHDNEWGDCICGAPLCATRKGQNKLGTMLMAVRYELVHGE